MKLCPPLSKQASRSLHFEITRVVIHLLGAATTQCAQTRQVPPVMLLFCWLTWTFCLQAILNSVDAAKKGLDVELAASGRAFKLHSLE